MASLDHEGVVAVSNPLENVHATPSALPAPTEADEGAGRCCHSRHQSFSTSVIL